MPPTTPSELEQAETARIVEQNRRFHDAYTRDAEMIRARHGAQTLAEASALRAKYAQPVFGEIPVWSLVEKLARVIDPCDDRLYCTSQEVHVLQIIDAMETDGMASEEFVLAAMLHDIGKVVLLEGEPAENVVYMNEVLLAGAPGAGLAACTLQWSCDDLTWSRLRHHLPPHVAWLIRYHGVQHDRCAAFMSAQDRDWAARYLEPFQSYDLCSKSPFRRPRRRLEDYRWVLDKYLPRTILF